ncbi:MAG: tripartite tricarboxylate transporter substrate binding protein [Acetobacteraceae bacterium]|nr:tripartite tricarboxylate transporter substrate binding protein [Acetobacteraceae bacterium]
MPRTAMLRRLVLALGLALAAVPANAQAPAPSPAAPPVRIIIAWPPGGTTDFVTRLYARHLGELLGQSFVVENRPGGGGSIAWRAVAGARPDGTTLLLTENSLATAPPLMPDLGLDVRADFTPVSLLVDYPSVIAVPAALPVQTLAELVALARRDPNALNFGSMGNGSSLHLYTEVLQDAGGFRMTHVPYRGAGPAFTDLVAGRIQVLLAAPPTVLGAVRGGQVRVLAIGTAGGRVPAFPNVPTAREAGVDFPLAYWYGLFGPRGLDASVAARLLDGVRRANALPEVQARFAEQGAIPRGEDGAALARLLAEDLARWTAIIREKGIAQ